MTKYLLAYHGGTMPASKEDGEKSMAAWMAWIGGLGAAVLDVGNPTTGNSKTVAPGFKLSNGGSTTITGYSIVEAASLDKAVDLTKNCPQLAAGGTIEVAELSALM
jgi:YCII-related domain